MNRRPHWIFVLAALGTASQCAGSDYFYFFTVSNEVSPDSPSTTVTLWAAFYKVRYAFSLSRTEVWGDADPGGFSDPEVLLYQCCHSDPGAVSPDGDSILGIRLLQLQGLGGYFADTSNPIAVWSATWSTDDFTPRSVPIRTNTSDFWVYLDPSGGGENYYGPDFSEAEGIIEVVRGCFPDFNGDGVLDLFDFLAFVNAYNAQDPGADCDRSGSFDLFDFICFINAFNAGC